MRDALRHVLFYESGDLSLAAEHFPAHQARYTEFMRRGVLLALGPFSDGAGSMAVFTTREAAEEFVSGDPFVQHGVVSAWQVREWRVASPDDLHLHGRALTSVKLWVPGACGSHGSPDADRPAVGGPRRIFLP